MNQSKFSLADVLTILTALAFGFLCFLGTNFYTLGNTTKSITAAVIIAFLLFSTAYSAKLLKRTSVNFKTCFIWEIILLVIFTLLFVFFTYMPFSHYFTVSTKQTVIISKIQKIIAQAQNMFTTYEKNAKERINTYKGQIESAVDNKGRKPSDYYEKFGFKIKDENLDN
jgi:FlaA1/EpsC-like NDP-sugar epimerase